jgi:hypothetical protein
LSFERHSFGAPNQRIEAMGDNGGVGNGGKAWKTEQKLAFEVRQDTARKRNALKLLIRITIVLDTYNLSLQTAIAK